MASQTKESKAVIKAVKDKSAANSQIAKIKQTKDEWTSEGIGKAIIDVNFKVG